MATHSSILAWENSETEDHGGLQSMLLQRVRHNWVTQTTYLLYQTILYEYTINQWSGTQAWTKMESSKASKVFMKRRKRTIHMYRYIGRLRGRVPELLSRGLVAVFFFFFKSLLWGISPGFLLASHFNLPSCQYIFGISKDPLVCAHASLGQDGFY